MFDRFETWLIIGLLLWMALCFLDERVCEARKRRKRTEKELKQMKRELRKKRKELKELKTQHKRNELMDVYIRDQRIEELEQENAKLRREVQKKETLLEQKWTSSCDMSYHSNR